MWGSSRSHSWSYTFPTIYSNDLPDDTNLYSKCDQASDLWLLELASELESDLRHTVDWNRMWLVDFKAGKTKLVLFDRSVNTGAIDVKTDESVHEEKSSFKRLGLTFFSKLDWGSYTISILLKMPPRKLEP